MRVYVFVFIFSHTCKWAYIYTCMYIYEYINTYIHIDRDARFTFLSLWRAPICLWVTCTSPKVMERCLSAAPSVR